MRYDLVTGPASEPVTIADLQANEFLKSISLIDAANVSLINSLIVTARQQAEKYTDRAIISQSWKLSLDYLPSCIEFRYGNLSTISAAKVVNADGTETTQDASLYSYTTGDRARLWLKNTLSWGTTERILDCFRVYLSCGWANAAATPSGIKQAIMITVAYLWTNRESINEPGLPPEAKNLLNPYRIIQI